MRLSKAHPAMNRIEACQDVDRPRGFTLPASLVGLQGNKVATARIGQDRPQKGSS